MITAGIINAGKLRVGVGVGAAPIALKDAASGDLRGPAVDLGRALAAQIGVDIVFVEYPRPGAVMEGVQSNAWDVAFLAFDPSRAEVVDYTPAYIRSDFTYMVPTGSSLRSAADTDQPGIRIVTPRNDGSDLQLTRALKRAQLIRTRSCRIRSSRPISSSVGVCATSSRPQSASAKPVSR
jgi:polar amino acid transport system substrate-binding protein